MTEQEKIEHISRNFHRLSGEEKDYLGNLSQALYYVQNPGVLERPGGEKRSVGDKNLRKEGKLRGI